MSFRSSHHAALRPAIPPPTMTTGTFRFCTGAGKGVWSRSLWPRGNASLTNEPVMLLDLAPLLQLMPMSAAEAAAPPIATNLLREIFIDALSPLNHADGELCGTSVKYCNPVHCLRGIRIR